MLNKLTRWRCWLWSLRRQFRVFFAVFASGSFGFIEVVNLDLINCVAKSVVLVFFCSNGFMVIEAEELVVLSRLLER